MNLKTLNLCKQYRDADQSLCVINDLTFDFPEQGSVAIMGRSGIGKSTLLHLLGGLDRSSSGSIYWGEQELSQLSPDQLSQLRGKSVGFIFQFHHLLGEFSALENVAMPLIIANGQESLAMEEAATALARVGLQSRASHRPGELSGGEQQRVAIARAIVTKPQLILADEPTGNLDVVTARDVTQLLLTVQRELGSLLLIVTHSSELADAMEMRLEMQPGGALSIMSN